MKIFRSRFAINTKAPFYASDGSTGFTPVITAPITIGSAGDVIDVRAKIVISGRPDPSQNYPGYDKGTIWGSAFFSARGIYLSASDPSGHNLLDQNFGRLIDQPLGNDGDYRSQPTHPYVTHEFTTLAIAQSGEVGTRWVSVVAWAFSGTANNDDWLLNEPGECQLDVIVYPSSAVSNKPALLSPYSTLKSVPKRSAAHPDNQKSNAFLLLLRQDKAVS